MPMSDYVQRLRSRMGSELLELASAGAIVFDAQRRILLVRHAEGVWTTPGGAVEPLESPADTVVREAWEETGLHVEPTRLMGVYGGPDHVVRYANGDTTSYVMVYFECRVLGGEPAPDRVETFEVGYFARDELTALELPGWLPAILADAFDARPEARFASAGWRPPTQRVAPHPGPR